MSMMMCCFARSAASAPRNAHQMNSSIATSIAQMIGAPSARETAATKTSAAQPARAARAACVLGAQSQLPS